MFKLREVTFDAPTLPDEILITAPDEMMVAAQEAFSIIRDGKHITVVTDLGVRHEFDVK